ncbi:MAG TPA: hypothetical protein DET40_07335 [Lentisphaeria bacterium]|nr:MAG: hypothetical protein A2X45_06965 [Lentisphaerae bacterium GWF2_50_93]HCE43344.1 hypothetical protein [Lentisphaeria bacterium]
MSSEKKDSGFSFENTPGKIGGDSKGGDDFTFTDIPVLGNIEKEKKSAFSFDRKKHDKPKEEHAAGADSSGNAMQQDMFQGQAQSQENWDKIAVKKKFGFKLNLSPKMLVIVAVAVGLVLIGGISAFVLLKPKQDQAAGQQASGAKPGKKDQKAEDEAKRVAELENRLAAAAAAVKESKFKEALKIYQTLLTESWKEKEMVLIFGEGECYENLKQDDDALKDYQKCIELGWKENPQPHLRSAKLLAKKEKKEESLKILEKAREAFPSDIPLGTQLALAYVDSGQTDKAAAEFKKIGKSDISLENLKLYCSILQKKQEKDQAKELYIYASKKFKDLDCFMSAALLSDKPQEKIDLMNQALTVIEENKKSIAIMYLTELLMQGGKKDEAAKQLDKINLGDLKPEKVTDFLKLLVTSGNLVKFKTEYKKAIELFPKDFFLHREIFEAMMENGQDKLALETYSEWWISKSSDYIAGYFYAKSLGVMPEEAVSIYRKVTELNPAFFEAFYELAYFHTLMRDFQNAESAYSECVRLKPADRNLRQLLAYSKAMNGKGEEGIDEYEKFLAAQNISTEEKASELLGLAFRLPTKARAEKYLNELKGSPKFAEEYKAQALRLKLVYGRLGDEDFVEPYPKAARKYHEYYLLSKGRFNEVLLMTVPPDEFPDFWKLFILWRNDKPGWQEGMEVLVAKNKDKKDSLYGIIASIWNGKLLPDDAKKHIEKIHPDNESLFYLILAEKFKKDKAPPVKAKVLYQKALSDRQNPIFCVVDFMAKQPAR